MAFGVSDREDAGRVREPAIGLVFLVAFQRFCVGLLPVTALVRCPPPNTATRLGGVIHAVATVY
jgi:hypothetical protein